MGPERGRARPPGTMSGSDSTPFLSQADDTDDGPAPGIPGLPGPMGNPKSEDPEVLDREGLQRITGLSSGRSALIVAVLCYINLLNYMDRFTVAGTDFREKVRRGEGSGFPKVGRPRPAHPESSSSQASFRTSSSSSTSETVAPASFRPVSGGSLLGAQQIFYLVYSSWGCILACLGSHLCEVRWPEGCDFCPEAVLLS